MNLRIRFYITLLVLLKAMAIAQPALSQSDRNDTNGEQLLFILPEGWKEEFKDRTESLSTTEYIPEGQTETDWEEMLTIQILLNKPSTDPVKMMSGITKYLSQDCRAFDYRPIDIGGIDNNYPSMAILALCGQKKERDSGYVSLLRGISGKKNFFLLQKTWKTKLFDTQKKSPINLEQRKFWLGYLSYLRICNNEQGDCPKNLKLD
ncbi:hypothetical protein OA861_01155 [Pseudomonadota bacterium]|nr:hypothetical protein [Pseudomonadota bacterium]